MSPKPSNQSGGQTHGCIYLKKNITSVWSLDFAGLVVFTVNGFV